MVIKHIDARNPVQVVWNFCIGSISYPKMGADLLDNYHLLVDIHGKRLIDLLTNLSSCGEIILSDQSLICTFQLKSRFSRILSEYKELA